MNEWNRKAIVSIDVYVDLLPFCRRVQELLKEKRKTVTGLARYLGYSSGGRKKLRTILESDEKIFDESNAEMRKRRRDVIDLAGNATSIANFFGVDVFELVRPAPTKRLLLLLVSFTRQPPKKPKQAP